MRRRTFDLLVSSTGVVLTIVLLVAGGLLFWGYSFANGSVHDQLAAQKIFFPAKGSQALAPPEIGRYLNRYAGQQLVTGAQAKAYADHYIAVHLRESAGGRTYAETSNLARQNPGNTELADQVQTLFRGETLRGLLLNAYAFWKIGQIALVASIASFALAVVMLVLTALGFWHLRRVSPTEELLTADVDGQERIHART
ncbi:MAG TPA: hypothetical protein VE776_09165 [Actinomycetota bacterium]|jgi:hypothetical protein|nr:hypothetical protein [Actinomycetota bacterium]